ncbi:ferrous iron transport protein B [Clostridium vincentii]|uniref:Ferrous iron transport protein B n=1 Tax=Clostridium vincentii TaxID=52704 RepID=A0A2T0BH72_9CLOT|nr:ferrous iron transport protein B [Clostridium vincentii]PRR83249.1 Ferrous iron transport protein B [Clostridium vincentii]
MGLNKNSTGRNILASDKGVSGKKVEYEIALAGNPNVGKSTVFNALTGLNQHTGNWPGKTVGSAQGYYEYQGSKIKVVDLPGTYSLLSNSEEEEIARDYICFNNPDLVVVIADATNLERNLNLFFQIAEITEKVILCVNLIDEAKKKDIVIEYNEIIQQIGHCVVLATARDNIGIEELKAKVDREIKGKRSCLSHIKYDLDIEEGIYAIKDILRAELSIDDAKLTWIALRFVEGNKNIVNRIKEKLSIRNEIMQKVEEIQVQISSREREKPVEDAITETLVNTAEDIASKVVKKGSKESKKNDLNTKIDKILVSKITGIPIMILSLLFILWVTITLANYPSQLLTIIFKSIEEWLRVAFSLTSMPTWVNGILLDGLYVTVAWVIAVMLPPMAIFFPMFTLLEDLGYLPRIAFNLDNCFKKSCSCGKQALTMCMGLGCNAAGVVGCRIINSPREKLIAIITNVFMPCNGRFPTLIAVASIFIGGSVLGGAKGGLISALAVTCIIILGVFMTLLTSRILSKTILKGVQSGFILELPPYRKPQIRKVLVRSIFDRTLFVLGRAISVAAPAGIVIWIFANVQVTGGTLLSVCAEFLTPFAGTIGLDGYILMAFILGFPANEIVLPIIIMSYLRAGTIVGMDSLADLKELLISNGWTLLTAINMMILCLMHYPCGTTLWTIKKETGSFKWTAIAFIIPTIAGIGMCFIITQIWRIVF